MNAIENKLAEVLRDTPAIDWTKIIIASVYFILVFAVIIIGQLMPMQKIMESIYGEIVIALLAPFGTIIGFYFGAAKTMSVVKSTLKALYKG